MSAGLSCARKPESKCARISCWDQGSSATARRNQVSCLPTGTSGTVLEMNWEDEAAVVARPCPVPPGEPVHPAAAPASTTPSPAHKLRLAAFRQTSRPALPCGKPPAESTPRLRSQNQFISSRPSQRSWYDHPEHEHATTALTRDYGLIATHAMTKTSAGPTCARIPSTSRALARFPD